MEHRAYNFEENIEPKNMYKWNIKHPAVQHKVTTDVHASNANV